jgi:hypothetical protein
MQRLASLPAGFHATHRVGPGSQGTLGSPLLRTVLPLWEGPSVGFKCPLIRERRILGHASVASSGRKYSPQILFVNVELVGRKSRKSCQFQPNSTFLRSQHFANSLASKTSRAGNSLLAIKPSDMQKHVQQEIENVVA